MLKKIEKIIENIEKYPLSLTKWLVAFFSLVVLRLLGEHLVNGLSDYSPSFFIGSFLVTLLFFSFSFILVLLFLAAYTKEPVQKAANLLLWGFFLIISPPIIDKIWCGARKCWSFYTFDSLKGLGLRFLTFFGDSPTVGITYGVRVEVALAVLFLAIYVFLKTKKIVKSLFGGLIAYAILFVLGSFPAWISFLVLSPEKKILSIEGFDVAGLFLSSAKLFSIENQDPLNNLNVKMNLIYGLLVVAAVAFFFWVSWREKFWAVVKNIRWIQIFIHGGLVLAGAGLGAFYFPGNMNLRIGQSLAENFFPALVLANLVLAAVFAWLAAVFINDCVDVGIDRETNKRRPLATGAMEKEEYIELFWLSFVLSLVLALAVGVKFFLLILSYQIIGWVYSARPFRLKRFPIVASFLSAMALILLFISGFILVVDNQNLSGFPMKIFWLMAVAFTVSLPIKDLKDIESDRKEGIFTIPVLLGETWARFFIGLGIFVSYALSVVWLNAKILFFPAMILGAASFWILQSKKISARRVHIWVFGFLFVYVLAMAWLVFWPAIKVSF
jgi:4-hydroxybenzoate polyprenyltransferase